MKKIVIAAATLALVYAASPALASGSGSGSGGGGGGFSSGFGGANSAQNQALREQQRQFRRGRSQVKKHITCKKCDYHKKLNKTNALEVAQKVIDGQYALKTEDRNAVLIYLRDRYKL